MNNFWQNKKVLITGHTGFKGTWLTMLLMHHGAKVYGLSSGSNGEKKSDKLFYKCKLDSEIKSTRVDVINLDKLYSAFKKIKPNFVFHLAAQPIVHKSYDDPVKTFQTNAMGTVNILECIRMTKESKVGIIVTTDKVYMNQNSIYPYNENSILGGKDPYSASKALAEIITSSYCESFFKNNKYIATVRAGNVIGGGDWSPNRIIPDLIRSWKSNKILEVRNPNHIRPWQHVLEPLTGYIKLAEFIYKKKIGYEKFNFGPEIDDTFTVKKLINEACKVIGKNDFIKFHKISRKADYNIKKEESKIFLDINKSKQILKFYPKLNFNNSISKTINWYINFYKGKSPKDLCKKDILDYLQNF